MGERRCSKSIFYVMVRPEILFESKATFCEKLDFYPNVTSLRKLAKLNSSDRLFSDYTQSLRFSSFVFDTLC